MAVSCESPSRGWDQAKPTRFHRAPVLLPRFRHLVAESVKIFLNFGDIKILVSIDPASFPLGTGPKPHEIWHSGYYTVVWTNTKYRMVYFNMGHNDIDYEHRYDTTNKTLSYTLNNPVEDRLIIDALLWLGGRTRERR